MRPQFEVIPGKSLGPISLAMTRDAVRAVLGTPSYVEAAYERWGISFPDKDCYSDAALQIRYSASGRVEDIQASSHDDFVVLFDGCDVHASTVEKIAAVVSCRGSLDRTTREFPHTYWYPSLGIALWRERSDSDRFDTINLTLPEKKE